MIAKAFYYLLLPMNLVFDISELPFSGDQIVPRGERLWACYQCA